MRGIVDLEEAGVAVELTVVTVYVLAGEVVRDGTPSTGIRLEIGGSVRKSRDSGESFRNASLRNRDEGGSRGNRNVRAGASGSRVRNGVGRYGEVDG